MHPVLVRPSLAARVCYVECIAGAPQTELDSHRERLRRLGSALPAWEQGLGEGLVLAGSRVLRRRQGPVGRPYVVWFLGGDKRLRDGAGLRRFAPGELLVIPPAAAFASEERPDGRGEFLAVRLEVEPGLLHHLGRAEPSVAAAIARPGPSRAASTHKPPVGPDLRDALDRCLDYAVRGAGSLSMARRRLEDVLVTLAEAEPAAVGALVRAPDARERLEGLLRRTPHASWILADAAAALAMSPATLKRRLARHGLTFSDLLQEVRLEEGRRLLVDHGQTVVEAALSVGYASPSKFAAAYRRRFGRPPGRDKTS